MQNAIAEFRNPGIEQGRATDDGFVAGPGRGGGIYTGQLNRGVAAHETATGTGNIMFSAEIVHTRFAGNSIIATNSDHFIAVQNAGPDWFFSNNNAWTPFTPTTNDRLLADVDFDNDTVTSLEGSAGQVAGIDLGYASGDLVFFADQWGGVFNDGEFQVTGTHFEHPPRVRIGDINYGIAVADNAAGIGYIMYSNDTVQSRLASILPGNSDHLIAVRNVGGQWQMNDNSLTWFDFTPVSTDRLLASVDFSADTITSLQGFTGEVNGIDQGYDSGDLTFTANLWAGAANPGEFTVGGTYFEVSGIAPGPIAPAVFDQAPGFTFDADGDGQVQPLRDGIQFVRFMAGFTDESFAWGASERDLYMDFDGNGKVEPLTDGILLVRFLAGFRGQSLVEGVLASNAIRADARTERSALPNDGSQRGGCYRSAHSI